MRPAQGVADSVPAQDDLFSKWVQIILGLLVTVSVVVVPILVALSEEEPEPAAFSGASPVSADDGGIPAEHGGPPGRDEPAGVSGASSLPLRAAPRPSGSADTGNPGRERGR